MVKMANIMYVLQLKKMLRLKTTQRLLRRDSPGIRSRHGLRNKHLDRKQRLQDGVPLILKCSPKPTPPPPRAHVVIWLYRKVLSSECSAQHLVGALNIHRIF